MMIWLGRTILSLLMMALASAGAVAADPATPVASPMSMSMSTGAAYLTITNNGDEDETLLAAKTDVAGAVEIHETKMDGDVMRMAPLKDGLVIPAGETVALEPGGTHLMLIGLTKSLIAGGTFELTLTFAQAGDVTVTVPILPSNPDDEVGEPVEVGDELEISNIWARQAPKIDGGMATPDATPEHQH